MRSVPRLCEFNPGICLTTEEKHGKTSVRVVKEQADIQAAQNYDLSEDDQELRPKNVGEILNQQKLRATSCYFNLFFYAEEF